MNIFAKAYQMALSDTIPNGRKGFGLAGTIGYQVRYEEFVIDGKSHIAGKYLVVVCYRLGTEHLYAMTHQYIEYGIHLYLDILVRRISAP